MSERGSHHPAYIHVVIVFIPFTVISEITSVVLDHVYKSHTYQWGSCVCQVTLEVCTSNFWKGLPICDP